MIPYGAAFADLMLTHPGSVVRRALSEVATALEYLREIGWIHRDMEPGNIVITERGAVLIDFNESAEEGQSCQPWATPKYAPPELLRAMDQVQKSGLQNATTTGPTAP